MLKVIVHVDNHEDIEYVIEYSHAWVINKTIFVQGVEENNFLTFEDDDVFNIFEKLTTAFEEGEEVFTFNFDEKFAPEFARGKMKPEIISEILEKFND